MNKLMIAINNFVNIINIGYKGIINRNQDLIKDKIIFYLYIDKSTTYFYIKNINKKNNKHRK